MLGVARVEGLEKLQVLGQPAARLVGTVKLALEVGEFAVAVVAPTFIEGFAEGADLEALSAS